jgi:hypothetical protein
MYVTAPIEKLWDEGAPPALDAASGNPAVVDS